MPTNDQARGARRRLTDVTKLSVHFNSQAERKINSIPTFLKERTQSRHDRSP